ncbi:MAG: hypothetical protein ACR2NI_08640 [Pirellulales bacterium]
MLSDAIHDNLPALKNACEHYTNDPTWQDMYPVDGPHSVVVSICFELLNEVRRDLDHVKTDRSIAEYAELLVNMREQRMYQVAFTKEDGSWDIVSDFLARDDREAEEIAEASYGWEEWYVLKDGKNINGGEL